MTRLLGYAAALLLPLCAIAPDAKAQDTRARIALGDRAQAAGDATAALRHYESAIAVDSAHYEALWKASREAIDIGEYTGDDTQRQTLFARAEGYARRAVNANPGDAEGHFALARALGRTALTRGARDRVRFAREVREHALTALRLDARHTGALHVMGVWNAEVMRLGRLERYFARTLLGGRVLETASWADAVRYLERAVELAPRRITHRLDLARVYADVENAARAREELEWILAATPADYNDRHYQREAEALLRALRAPR